jgi:hypothetical protein
MALHHEMIIVTVRGLDRQFYKIFDGQNGFVIEIVNRTD